MLIDCSCKVVFNYLQTKLPPRPQIQRGEPLDAQQWASHFDSEGCMTGVEELKEIIFRGVSTFLQQKHFSKS